MFTLEKDYLKLVPNIINKPTTSLTYSVRKNNTVLYKQNRYQIPKGTYQPSKEVKLVIVDRKMDIVDGDTGQIIAIAFRKVN